MEVHAPPALDSFNSYAAKGRALALNAVLHDRAHPSRISLPVVPLTGVTLGAPIRCGQQYMVRCVPG